MSKAKPRILSREVQEVMIRVLGPTGLAKMYPHNLPSRNCCFATTDDKFMHGVVCLAPKGHDGPHIAHIDDEDAIFAWVNTGGDSDG